MKLTIETLKKLIKEEIRSTLSEGMYLKYVDNQKYPVRFPDATLKPEILYKLPDEELDRLEKFAVEDKPNWAIEVANGLLGLDDEQEEKEISDYYYDIAIANVLKGAPFVVFLEKIPGHSDRGLHIYQEVGGDYDPRRGGRLWLLRRFRPDTPRSYVLEVLKDEIKRHIGDQG